MDRWSATELARMARLVAWDPSFGRDPATTEALILGLPIEGIPLDRLRMLLGLIEYEARRRVEQQGSWRAPQRRAYRLLRSLLSVDQLHQLRRSRCFRATGSAGGVYRLHPATGWTCRVERYGSRWWAVESYCLHDHPRVIPPADLTVAHLLRLRVDEPGFLAEANATAMGPRDLLWNGVYARRLRLARACREWGIDPMGLTLEGMQLAVEWARAEVEAGLAGPALGPQVPDMGLWRAA